MINLKEAYGRQYKTFIDESWEHMESKTEADKPWYYELRGRYGTIYPYDEKRLAMDITSVKVATKMTRALKDKLSLFIDRSDGGLFLFEPKYLGEIDQFIKLRRKRQGRKLSPEERARFIEGGRKYRFGYGA